MKEENQKMGLDSLLIKVEYSVPLSNAVKAEYNKLMESLELVPINLRSSPCIEGTGGQVSVRDLLAYQIGWGKLLLGWYQAGLNKEIPKMPGEGFSSWDYNALAKHFYQKYEYDCLEEKCAQFFLIVKEILNIIERENETGNLNKIGVWAWCTLKSGKSWPLSKWIQVNTVSPYKRATTLIKKFAKTQSLQDKD